MAAVVTVEELKPRDDLCVRTFKVASGVYFLSFVEAAEAPSLGEMLDVLPLDGDVVVNVDDLSAESAHDVARVLARSRRVALGEGLTIVVCAVAPIRRVFESSRPRGSILVEESLDRAFRYVFRRSRLLRMASELGPTAR